MKVDYQKTLATEIFMTVSNKNLSEMQKEKARTDYSLVLKSLMPSCKGDSGTEKFFKALWFGFKKFTE